MKLVALHLMHTPITRFGVANIITYIISGLTCPLTSSPWSDASNRIATPDHTFDLPLDCGLFWGIAFQCDGDLPINAGVSLDGHCDISPQALGELERRDGPTRQALALAQTVNFTYASSTSRRRLIPLSGGSGPSTGGVGGSIR